MAINVKHVGKLNTGQRVVVLFKTVPNEPHNCLVTETQLLPSLYHDRLMELVESEDGQQSAELADLLSRRFFADGTNVLSTLHSKGFIRKINTKNVLLTPNTATSVPLNEVNDILQGNSAKKVDAAAYVPTPEAVAPAIEPATENLWSATTTAAVVGSALDNSKVVKTMLEQAEAYEKEAQRLREHAAQLSTNGKTKKRGRSKAS